MSKFAVTLNYHGNYGYVEYDSENKKAEIVLGVAEAKAKVEKFLNENFDKLLPCFEGQPSHMLSWNEYHLKANNDRVEHIIEPVRFTVDFKDEFATISTFR